MIVLDASAVVEFVLGTLEGKTVAERIAPAEVSLEAPHLLTVAVAQAPRSLAGHGKIPPERCGLAQGLLEDLTLEHHPHRPLLPRIWEHRHEMTAYDATYVSLAEVLGAVLLTCDRRLARTADRFVDVELVE